MRIIKSAAKRKGEKRIGSQYLKRQAGSQTDAPADAELKIHMGETQRKKTSRDFTMITPVEKHIGHSLR